MGKESSGVDKKKTVDFKDSENYIVVIKEFLLSGILNAKLKIKFSKALLSWLHTLKGENPS